LVSGPSSIWYPMRHMSAVQLPGGALSFRDDAAPPAATREALDQRRKWTLPAGGTTILTGWPKPEKSAVTPTPGPLTSRFSSSV
jgi:hypothetical protein